MTHAPDAERRPHAEASPRPPAAAVAVISTLSEVALVTVLAPLPDDGVNLLYAVVTGGAGLLALVGARRRPVETRTVPMLVAVGVCTSALADLAYAALDAMGDVGDASAADPPYLLGSMLLATALFVATASDHGRRLDVDAVVDALTVIVVTVLVLADLQARVGDSSGTPAGQAVLTAYPVIDAVMLALVARAVWGRRRRSWGIWWVVSGTVCWLATDLVVLLGDTDLDDGWLNLGWLVGALLLAWSTWAGAEEDPGPARAPGPGARVLIAILPLGVPPLMLLLPRDDRDHSAVTALVSMAILLALAVIRTTRLLAAEELARRELEVARDEALAASRAKSDFLATMSHEIRTPMNGVLGLTALLLDGELEPRQRQYATGVATAGGALMRIIDDLLDSSRIEAGHLNLVSEEVDVARLLAEVTALAAEATRRDAGDVRVTCDVPAVLGDAGRIRQVMLNLVANALKFTAEGVVQVSAAVEGADPVTGGVVVRFEVVDQGIGIGAADLAHIFEPFAQADSSSTREFGGTGLGLSISRRLVAAMGGVLQVESEPGRGSRFWFSLTLPLVAGRRVLLVEDGEVNQLVAEGILTHLGYEVLDHADPADVDLVVADLGRAAAVGSRGTPVVGIALPGGTDHDAGRAAAAGVVEVVGRPLDPASLGGALRRAAAAGATRTSPLDDHSLV